jgi:hydroxymethylglutaryl-CoA lyase
MIKLIECPRDAMQGWKEMIPTQEKANYINALLKVGFDTIDFGSFVSAAAIPQMADTRYVLDLLDLGNSRTKLLAIVANTRGAIEAASYEAIHYLGFPYSVSETFQHRNINSKVDESFRRVEAIQEICVKSRKELVLYISMGFGNPYGDPWSAEIVYEHVTKLVALDIGIISLADTVGLATSTQVYEMTNYLVDHLPGCEIGVHLHSSPFNWLDKVSSAFRAGCRRFDGALGGIGGCPLANDELVGNMDTRNLITFFEKEGISLGLDQSALESCNEISSRIFSGKFIF